MALSLDELHLIDRLKRKLDSTATQDELLLAYYQMRQRTEHIGMAVPPEMRNFLVPTSWCEVAVDRIDDRQEIRALTIPGQETADPRLRDIADNSNLETHVSMMNRDAMVFSRGFMSVGSNEDHPELPLMRAESPREMSAIVNVRTERIEAAARFYGRDDHGRGPINVTLYKPDETVWLTKDRDTGRWDEVSRDQHRLGVVPIVMHVNRRMSGDFDGRSQLVPIIPLVDSVTRSLTNMQFAQEAHGIPRVWMTGVAMEHFKNSDGTMRSQFEAYYDAIHTLTGDKSRVGQLDAADLKNFETAVQVYGKMAAIATGFPARYFGLTTVNPAAEGALVADEAILVRDVERRNRMLGVTVGWAGGLAWRFATGDWVTGNRVRASWFDPATPTYSQRAEAVFKMASSERPVLSREGAWDEMGWSEARKAKEREYFARERAEGIDPYLSALVGDDGPRADPTAVS